MAALRDLIRMVAGDAECNGAREAEEDQGDSTEYTKESKDGGIHALALGRVRRSGTGGAGQCDLGK